uniref:Uncharacterized protein n=1 Tax=Tetranychus urticae TaxID=32264 RepID=T1KAQ0_TETUR
MVKDQFFEILGSYQSNNRLTPASQVD